MTTKPWSTAKYLAEYLPFKMLTVNELPHLINRDVSKVFNGLDLADWNEDYISIRLVQSLRTTLRNVKNVTTSQSTKSPGWERPEARIYFDVEAYKTTGPLEQKHGDIAVVVRDIDLNRTGVGFYEAKAEAPCGGYPAFKMRQLRRLASATPHLALLLYERTEKAVSDDEYSFPDPFIEPPSTTSRLRVHAADIAKLYARPERIPDPPDSFGHHFVSRYLTGRNLDYSRDPQLAIQRWLKVTRRAPPIVVSLIISRNPMGVVEPRQSLLPGYASVPLADKVTIGGRPHSSEALRKVSQGGTPSDDENRGQFLSILTLET